MTLAHLVKKDDFDACHLPEGRHTLRENDRMLLDEIRRARTPEVMQAILESLSPRPCPLCDSTEHVARSAVKNGMTIVECRHCGFIYSREIATNRLELHSYKNLSTATAFAAHHNQQTYLALARKKHAYYLQLAAEHTRKGKHLDIGCGAGVFIEDAITAGWESCGVDASEHFVRMADTRGLSVRQCYFPDDFAPDTRFDLVTLLDVLEHLPAPEAGLHKASCAVADGGVLLVQVPNYHSPLFELEGVDHRNFCYGHWNYFTPATLRALADHCGLKTILIDTVITEMDLMENHPRERIQQVIDHIAGHSLSLPTTLTTDWLYQHQMGYKLIGLFARA